MADVASKLKVSELDFDTIKTNLKNFLGDQNEFADYNLMDQQCPSYLTFFHTIPITMHSI